VQRLHGILPARGKAGEVLNAIRKQSIKHVAMVPLFAKIAQDPKLIWLMFAIPMVLFYIIMPHKSLDAIPRVNGEMVYHMFMPVFPHIDVTFILTGLVFAGLSAVVGIMRMWKGMKAKQGKCSLAAVSLEISFPP